MSNKKPPVYFVPQEDKIGVMYFTFDGRKFFNLFHDYPYALKPGEKELFDKTFPKWAEFFKDRKIGDRT